jgi:poly-gamma-glutamate synthesis protein (capsule biosynthesis protein)
VRGVNVGLLSFTRLLNSFRNPASQDEPHVAYVPYASTPEEVHAVRGLSTDELLERVRAAAARCEALLVLVHWGTEYQSQPREEDRALAQALFEAGALAVIGHHPHVLQPVEYQKTAAGRRTLVAFSLGNLLANQDRHYVHGQSPLRRGDKRDSLLLRVQLVRRGPGAPVELESASLLPVWIDNNREQRLRGTRVPRRIQPVLIDSELVAAAEQLAALEAQGPARDEEQREARKALEQRKVLLESRRERILQLMPSELVPGAPAPTAAPPQGG